MTEIVCVCTAVVAAVAMLAFAMTLAALLRARRNLSEANAARMAQESLAASREEALRAQKDALRAEFGQLAANLIVDRQRALAEANRRGVAELFGDLKVKIDEYSREIRTSIESNSRLGVEMKEKVDAMQRIQHSMDGFAAALTAGNKLQGNQGEFILANILEKSGFVRGEHFDVQVAQEGGRPDVSVYDARNRRELLIDSKMNIKDFIEAYNLPDDAEHRERKARAMKAHAASVRRQIDNLSSKDYARTAKPREGYEILPLVAMFCPFDAVLEAALIESPSLMQYAYERNVVIVTPLTLWGYFWLVSWGWRRNELERRYDEIQKLGQDVVAALDLLMGDLAEVGNCLRKTQTAYDSLLKRATTDKGQMSVRRVGEKLTEYGIGPRAKGK